MNASFFKSSTSWKFSKCKEPSYLRSISADLFELVGIPQEQDDDLSDLIDYDVIQENKAVCSAEEDKEENGEVCTQFI